MIEILYFILVFISAFSIGKKIINKLDLNAGFFESIAFSSAIGLGAASYMTFFLGMLSLLYKPVIMIVMAAALFASKSEIARLFREIKYLPIQIKKNFKGINLILLAILLAFIFLNFTAGFSPPYLWDEVTYNIALPKIYASHHRIIPTYDEIRSNFPFNINMLFTLGIVLGNFSLAKLFMFGYGALLALAIFTFSRRHFSMRASLLAALIFYTMPMVSSHTSSTYVDIGVAFYVFMAFYAFYLWPESGFFLSSVLAGLALASKNTAIYYMPVFWLFIAYRLRLKNNFWGVLKKTAAYFFIALLVASPWYAKSFFYTNDPIFPFGKSLYGKLFHSDQTQLADYNFGSLASKRSFFDFLIKFWQVTMHSSDFGMLLGFGPIFLVFVPLVFFMRKIDKVIAHLLVFSFISFALWYFSPQDIRYLLVYPMLSVVSAAVINSLLNSKKIKIIAAILLLSTLLFNIALWYGANSLKIPYILGLESEQQFYNKLKDNNGYNVFKYANDNLPKNSKLLLFREIRGYLSNLDYIKSDPFGQKVIDFSKISSSSEMHSRLKELGITHVFVNNNLDFVGKANPSIPPRYTEKEISIMNEALKLHGNLLYSEKGVYLYELKNGQ